MMNTRRILTAFAACALMCGVANASTLMETFTGTATSSTATDFAGLLTTTQFNPAWGTLTAVEIDLTSNATTDHGKQYGPDFRQQRYRTDKTADFCAGCR